MTAPGPSLISDTDLALASSFSHWHSSAALLATKTDGRNLKRHQVLQRLIERLQAALA